MLYCMYHLGIGSGYNISIILYITIDIIIKINIYVAMIYLLSIVIMTHESHYLHTAEKFVNLKPLVLMW